MKKQKNSSVLSANKLFSNIYLSFSFFFLLNLALLINAKVFSLQSFMAHPQFGFETSNFDLLTLRFKSVNGYVLYFGFDMLYMASICWLVYIVFKTIEQKPYLNPKKKLFGILLSIFGILSVVFDIWENTIYLGLFPKSNIIETAKKSIISLFLITIIYFLVINIPKRNWFKLIQILKSSFLSILIIIIIGMGLTFLPQGATLVVHLIDAPQGSNVVNLTLTILFVNMLAIIISHFPTYFDFAFNIHDKKGKVKWNLTNICCGIGYITYNYKEQFILWKKFIRHFLGILMFAAWFYVIYKAFDIYQITLMNSFKATVIVTVAISFLYWVLLKKSKEIKDKFFKALFENTEGDYFRSIRTWSNWFIILMTTTIIFGALWLSITYLFGWEKSNLRIYFIFAFFNVLTYMLFRLTRSMWVYAWGDEKVIRRIIKIDHKQSNNSLNLVLKNNLFNNTPLSLINPKYYLTRLSSNVNYLKLLRVGGGIALLFLVITNILLGTGQNVTYFSSIPILLAFIIILYSLITIAIKHIVFYRKHDSKNHFVYIDNKWKTSKKSETYKKWFSPVAIVLILLTFAIVSNRKGSFNIHKLSFINSKSNISQNISLKDFIEDLKGNIETKNIKKLSKVASFGGGMKSNLWNLLVMNKITSSFEDNSYFMDRCISLSGVSGGAVGLGNYLALDYLYRGNDSIMKIKIDEIGNANILAIDMAGILIHDWVRDLGHIDHNDRSYFAMKKYNDIISEDFNEKSFFKGSQRNVWSNMYRKHNYLPALIINTAATGLHPGIAFSLNQNKNKIFPSYIDLSDSNKDLKYYDAISTSNRFPIMSPVAQVENKGFFLDGGYFENSGLLTSSYFNKFLNDEGVFISGNESISTLTINIINGKSNYIRHFVEKYKLSVGELNYSPNIKSIITGITDIDKLPNVLHKAEKRYYINGDSICEIYLPHWITVSDISKALEGKIEINNRLLDALQQNNNKIKEALSSAKIPIRKGIVEPPLSRTLSNPAVEYQKAMINYHEDCLSEINRIKDYLSE